MIRHIQLLASAALMATAVQAEPSFWKYAPTPPMGWNSWDCYGAGVWESNVIANAGYMAGKLKSHGWDTITIDIQSYEPLAHTDAYRRGAVLEMDTNGRLLPATNRFPMPNVGVAAAIVQCGKGKIVLLALPGLMDSFVGGGSGRFHPVTAKRLMFNALNQ